MTKSRDTSESHNGAKLLEIDLREDELEAEQHSQPPKPPMVDLAGTGPETTHGNLVIDLTEEGPNLESGESSQLVSPNPVLGTPEPKTGKRKRDIASPASTLSSRSITDESRRRFPFQNTSVVRLRA